MSKVHSRRRHRDDGEKKKPVVVVVGGGYAGVAAAKALDRTGLFGVLMVDRKDYFAHSIGSLRSLTTEGYEQNVLIPYGNFMSHNNGVVVRADVKEISRSTVVLNVPGATAQPSKKRRRVQDSTEERLRYDYLVLATGSAYGAFGKPTSLTTREEALHMCNKAFTAVQSSYDIAIVGGGPVGCQLAAELATAYKGSKRITLLQAETELTPGPYSELFRTKVAVALQKMGVKVITGERVHMEELEYEMRRKNTIDTGYLLGKRVLRTSTRRELTCELVFICTGTKAQAHPPYDEFLHESIDPESGRIKVNKYFQVIGHSRVFAIGDCCNMDTEQRASLAHAHATHAVRNIASHYLSHHQREQSMERYTRNHYPGIKLALGARGGATQLPTETGSVLGRVYTRHTKSRKLDVPRVWKSLHQSPSDVRKADKLRQLAVQLSDEMPSEELADIIPTNSNNNNTASTISTTTTATTKQKNRGVADWCRKRNKVAKFLCTEQAIASHNALRLSEITGLPLDQSQLLTAVPQRPRSSPSSSLASSASGSGSGLSLSVSPSSVEGTSIAEESESYGEPDFPIRGGEEEDESSTPLSMSSVYSFCSGSTLGE
eukprot:TRINITY_DN277_c0_g1_i1.p1 TRINITY_DN277_c0_g1~~TRINITY_DN277_c0_g1_i1.p1  ORF type:complete len:603 (-),score=135.44 TRINITY_DN277_c0_g1_i1:103-1911(-)